MWGKKQARIEELESQLAIARKSRDAYQTEAHQSATGYKTQIIGFTEDLVREREINQALADENRDLVRQLQLLQSLFKQLNIQIKLPAKNARG